jgi:hypothetical protein
MGAFVPEEVPLIEQHGVTFIVGEAHATYSRFHDLYDGLTWRLCRDPVPEEAVEIAPETYVIRGPIHNFPGFCQIVMAYTFANNQLVVEDLKVEPNPPIAPE